ncbi:hypothetical protein DUI87_17238 [Hirundo rustica rustica]|uniref:Uncharacterized protein n=1 Tax=Hirundo rustica rustica TaxID=333673 RepID=A0A3M0JXZ9_HIRRU|nr:hypothetical protein DUI87_17238 [Hirundo rustica rustica]
MPRSLGSSLWLCTQADTCRAKVFVVFLMLSPATMASTKGLSEDERTKSTLDRKERVATVDVETFCVCFGAAICKPEIET